MLTDSHTIALSLRDRFILSQALLIGIKELNKVPAPYTEISNILDMEYLLENQFSDIATAARMSVDLAYTGYDEEEGEGE